MDLRDELSSITKQMEQDNVDYVLVYRNPETGDIIFGANGMPTSIGMMLYTAMEDQPVFSEIMKRTVSAANRIDEILK